MTDQTPKRGESIIIKSESPLGVKFAASLPFQHWIEEVSDIQGSLVTAGYGGISLQTPDSSLGTVTAFEVIPFDTTVISDPRGITQDLANNGLIFNNPGVWRVSVGLSMSHDEINSGRQFSVQIFNATESIGLITLPWGIGRNVGVTNPTGAFLIDVTDLVVGDLIQIRIGNGDTLSSVVIEYATYSANHVSGS